MEYLSVTGDARVDLRINGERAVLSRPADVDVDVEEVDPYTTAIGAELAAALHEWARVAAGVRRAAQTPAGTGAETAMVVSRRGRQLAARVASVMGTPVRYLDPVTEVQSVIEPPPQEPVTQESAGKPRSAMMTRLIGVAEAHGEPTPWLTGLTIAAFIATVVVVAMLALAAALTRETSGWFAVLASLVIAGGFAPSLWLARKLPILRWVVLGAVIGISVSWVGMLSVVL